MARKPTKLTEESEKAAEDACAVDGARTPMERFRAIGRRLVVVPQEELAEQQRQYEEAAVEKRRTRRKPP